jgi:xanthine dehydrogenase accessory factor
MKAEILEALNRAREAKQPVALATELKSGAQRLVTYEDTRGDLELGAGALPALRQALAEDASGPLELDGREIFVQVFNPPLRLAVVGAVHIAQALVPMAALAGFAVTVIDPRGAFATDARFPGVAIAHDWPDDSLKRIQPDRRTAIVTLTHDPKIDDPGLVEALRSDAFYIGALGSKRTHASRLERLREAGFTEAQLARIHGPIGLALGGRSPAEIAIAILAQITLTRHAKPAAQAAA